MANTTAARLGAALERIVEESLADRGIGVQRFERDARTLLFPMAAEFSFALSPRQ